MTNAPAAPKTALKIEEVTATLKDPWGLQFLPDGRMLVTERPGRLRLVAADGTLSEPIAGLPAVAAGGPCGRLEVLPDFPVSTFGKVSKKALGELVARKLELEQATAH